MKKIAVFSFLLTAMLGLAFTAAATPPEDSGWTTDAKAAFAAAKEKKQPVLAFFTGSDWCPYCIKMNKETLSTKEFKDFTKDKLVLLYLDFPSAKEPTKEAVELKNRYGVEGFPTTMVLDAEGKVLGSMVGFVPAKTYIAQIQKIIDQQKKAK